MLARLKIGIGLLLLLLVVVFTVQNAGVVAIRFLGWELVLSLALLVFIALAIGGLAGWLAGSLPRRGSPRALPADRSRAQRGVPREGAARD